MSRFKEPVTTSWGKISWAETFAIIPVVLKFPVLLTYTIATLPLNKSKKTSARVVKDWIFRYILSSMNIGQCQYLFGTTDKNFKSWGKANQVDIAVEDIGDGAQLLWMGEKRSDRVILYLHGGAFVLPFVADTPDLLRHLQLQLSDGTSGVGLALLDFTSATDKPFPTQLHQANLALTHLFKAGLVPENLQLIGDSAGGNLILQVLSHALHPFPDPSFSPSPLAPIFQGNMKPVSGAYLLSPWVNIGGFGGSFEDKTDKDCLGIESYQTWGTVVLSPIPKEHRDFIEFQASPLNWFEGLEKIINRVLVTAGGDECLCADIVMVANERLAKHHPDVKLIVQQHGVHEEPIFAFTGKDKEGEITKDIVRWFKDGFNF